MKGLGHLAPACLLLWVGQALSAFAPPGEPKAHASAVVVSGGHRFTVLSPHLVRLEYGAPWEDGQTFVAVNRAFPAVPFNTTRGPAGAVTLETDGLTLRFDGTPGPLTALSLNITMKEPNFFNESVWTLASSASDGNLLGTFHNLDNMKGVQDLNCSSQINAYANAASPYSHWWCALGLISRSGWSVVDDSRTPVFSEDDWIAPRLSGRCGGTQQSATVPCLHPPHYPLGQDRPTELACKVAGCCWVEDAATNATKCVQRSGSSDRYFFGHGVGKTQYRAALRDFQLLSGPIPVPRRHMLGMSWSRWSSGSSTDPWRGTAQDMKDAVNGLAEAGFPLDQFIIDMNWHGPATAWTGYTWNETMYPNHTDLLDFLRTRGLATSLNLHDQGGVQAWEARWDAVAEAMGIEVPADPGQREAIPFHYSNRTYASTLLEVVLAPLAKEGVSFWWNDWQAGYGSKNDGGTTIGTSDMTGVNPTMLTNHHRFMNPQELHPATMAALRPGSALRGAVHGRFGGLGGHRYPTQFGGDIVEVWETLAFLPYHVSTAANVLVAYWAEEINAGGYQSPVDLQFFTRLIQFGAWSPVFTSFGNTNQLNNFWADSDLPQPYRGASQMALAHRAMTIPYRYTLAFKAHLTGLAPIRPMYYDHPWKVGAYNASYSQYMLGDHLLAVPVAGPLSCGVNCSSGTAPSAFWLPGSTSEWVPAFLNSPELPTSSAPDGRVSVQSALGEVPVYARVGSMIPTLPYATAIRHGSAARAFDPLEWVVYSPGLAGSTEWVFEDDGMTKDFQDGETFANISAQYSVDPSSRCVTVKTKVVGGYYGAPENRTVTFRLVNPERACRGSVLAPHGDARLWRGGRAFVERNGCKGGGTDDSPSAPWWCTVRGGTDVLLNFERAPVENDLASGLELRWCGCPAGVSVN